MKIDLSYNRIVADTMTEGFRAAFEARVPEIAEERYPGAVALVMYEDYIADELMRDDRWYYPLTVRDGEGAHTLWLSWPFSKDKFSSRSPYSYIGEEELEIIAPNEVPKEFCAVLSGRAIDYTEGVIKLAVRAATDDALILVGKYSQTFVDELARQITPRIERAAGVEGFAESPIELELVFAPGTYMEHTSENVTYRRLLLVDGASAPRDFWVKWTRVGAEVAYTVSDNVSPDEIVFELGEDVAQKIREKEYRFLCSSNPNKYRSAMGKRTVTEWRDVIKRAIRRGELTKVAFDLGVEEREESEVVAPEVVRDTELEEGLARVLGIPEVPVPETETDTADNYDDLNDMLRRVLVSTEDRGTASDGAFGIDLPEEPLFTADAELEVAEEIVEEPAEDEVIEEEVAEEEKVEDEAAEEEIVEEEAVEEEIVEEEAVEEELVDEDEAVEEEIVEDEAVEEEIVEEDEAVIDETVIDEPVIDEPVIEEPTEEPISEINEELERLREAQMRDKIIAEARIEAEMRARASLEAEAELLRQERERLRRENERLLALAREAEERHSRAVEEQRIQAERSRLTEDMLRREIDARDRQEARERDRIAEAARISIEEQRRLEAEERAEALRREEERRAAEEERIAREREAEKARIEEAHRATVAPPTPTPAPVAPTPAPVAAPQASGFMSKRVKIIFRQPVDFSIMGKIKEAIERTLVSTGKSDVPIHMKAYPEENDVITLHITKMPAAEYDLLIAIVKAIGNAKIGVTKILLE